MTKTINTVVFNERQQFSSRLSTAMRQMDLSLSPTRLARAFNGVTKGEKISCHAARKWLVGESIPTQYKIQELAAMFGCEAQWLRFGETEAVFKEMDISVLEQEMLNKMRTLSQKEKDAVFGIINLLAENHK